MFKKTGARIYNWLKQAAHDEACKADTPWKTPDWKSTGIASDKKHLLGTSRESLDTSGIHFKVLPGYGGIAIEATYYDAPNERDIITLHIIPEGSELSEELAKIITLESLRRR